MIFCYCYSHAGNIEQTVLDNLESLPEKCFWMDVMEPTPTELQWLKEFFHETPDVEAGMGVEFTNLTKESRRQLRNFVKRRDPIFYDEND